MELRRWCLASITPAETARWASRMAVSLLWAAYAMALVTIGFWRRTRALRVTALGLFALTGFKVVLFDIAGIRELYRILALFVLAVLMLVASYLYHRLEPIILAKVHDGPERGAP